MSTSAAPLPHRDSPRIHLVRATVAENIAQTVTNSIEWRGPLNQEGYMKREAHLAEQTFARNGGLMAWMLVEELDGQDEHGHPRRRILCGCETLRKRALAVGDDVNHQGEAHEVLAYGVASVFCAKEFRGQGYASRMIMELGKRLERGFDPEDASLSAIPKSQQAATDTSIERPLFSVLYSDIGTQFYAAHGWAVYPSTHISLPPASASSTPPTNVKYLSRSELPPLCAIDEAQIRRRMPRTLAARKQSGAKTTAIIAQIPEYTNLEWHLAREAFISKEILGKVPDVHGAIVELSPGRRAWCYFTRMFGTANSEEDPNVLHIMRLVVEEGPEDSDINAGNDDAMLQGVLALFRAAQIQSREWDMREAQLWNPSELAVAAASQIVFMDSSDAPDSRKIAVVERGKHSIASMRWFGDKRPIDEVEWTCNEKFGWC